MGKSDVAIFISLGSLVVSFCGLVFSIIIYLKGVKRERTKAYDKVYGIASDLLIYNYKKIEDHPYESDDKILEKAVNTYAKSHSIEKIFGSNIDYPEEIKTKEERNNYFKKVSDEYYNYENKKHVYFCNNIEKRSPVFNLEDGDYERDFSFLIEYITNNLSYFSSSVVSCWEKMRTISPNEVHNEYISLQRVNKSSCTPIEEIIDDPYLNILLIIRDEYRRLNEPFKKRISKLLFRVKKFLYFRGLFRKL